MRMVAQKEMLPQSTERIVEVQGTPEGIQRAIWEICKCLVDDWQRGTGTVLYNPVVRTQGAGGAPPITGSTSSYVQDRVPYSGSRVTRTGNGADFSNGAPRPYNRRSDSDAAARGPPTHDENGEEIQTQNISIPADMVGCIIGRAGSKISEIRKTSGARISIAKVSAGDLGVDRAVVILLTRGGRLPTMRLASACSPSWARPRPTRRPSICSTRTWRRRRCAASSRRPRRLTRARTKAGGATGCNKNPELLVLLRLELGEWDSLPVTSSRGFFWVGSDLAAPRYGSSTRSDCRKALLFRWGGTRCDDHNSLTQPKKAFRRILLSSFPSSWTEFTPSSYPLYSATTDRPAIRHGHLDDDAIPQLRFALSLGLTGREAAESSGRGRGPSRVTTARALSLSARSQAPAVLMATMARKQNLANSSPRALLIALPPSHPQITRFLNPPSVYLSLLRPAVWLRGRALPTATPPAYPVSAPALSLG